MLIENLEIWNVSRVTNISIHYCGTGVIVSTSALNDALWLWFPRMRLFIVSDHVGENVWNSVCWTDEKEKKLPSARGWHPASSKAIEVKSTDPLLAECNIRHVIPQLAYFKTFWSVFVCATISSLSNSPEIFEPKPVQKGQYWSRTACVSWHQNRPQELEISWEVACSVLTFHTKSSANSPGTHHCVQKMATSGIVERPTMVPHRLAINGSADECWNTLSQVLEPIGSKLQPGGAARKCFRAIQVHNARDRP
jgi:hypothetical protein